MVVASRMWLEEEYKISNHIDLMTPLEEIVFKKNNKRS